MTYENELVIEKTKRLPKLNWGGFWLTWIWGIGNKSYIALLVLIPVLNLIMPFFLLFKGNELAYDSGDWFNENHFIETQRKWALVGWVFGLLVIGFYCLRFYAVYEESQAEDRLVTQVIQLIEENEEVSYLVERDYEIKSVIGFSVGTYQDYTLFLQSGYDSYWLHAQTNEAGDVIDLSMEITVETEKKETIQIY